MIWRLTKLRVAIEKTSSRLSKSKKRRTKPCANLFPLMPNVHSKLLQIESQNLPKTYLSSNVKQKKKLKHVIKKNSKSKRVSV